MEIKDLPLGYRSRLTIARGRYETWIRRSKTSKIYLSTLFAMCEGICPVCGVDMVLGFSQQTRNLPFCATLDHTIPLSKVLEHKKFGLEIMCKQCNSEKGSKKL